MNDSAFSHVIRFKVKNDKSSALFHPSILKTTQENIGYGKIILFGEHFVVYGLPAIVAAVEAYTTCTVEVIRSKVSSEPKKASCASVVLIDVYDERPAVDGYKVQKATEQCQAHALIIKHLFGENACNLPIEANDMAADIYWRTNAVNAAKKFPDFEELQCENFIHLRIILGGTLIAASGVGASAADCVSVSRALDELYGLQLSAEGINACGFHGECGYHGSPSGIDNTASTYGGMLLFSRGVGIDALKQNSQGMDFGHITSHSFASAQSMRITFGQAEKFVLPILAICTGITASTKEVVRDVRLLQEREPATFKAILAEYTSTLLSAFLALQKRSIPEIGSLMCTNHSLLKQIGVSCKELDDIIDYGRGCAGFCGGKLSGTGRGGIAVVLCASQHDQAAMMNAFSTHDGRRLVTDCIWAYTLSIA